MSVMIGFIASQIVPLMLATIPPRITDLRPDTRQSTVDWSPHAIPRR